MSHPLLNQDMVRPDAHEGKHGQGPEVPVRPVAQLQAPNPSQWAPGACSQMERIQRLQDLASHTHSTQTQHCFIEEGSATTPLGEHLELNSGALIPRLGLGTFKATKPGEVAAAVKAAVRAGYRLLDCAAGYGNQAEVGTAIAELVAEGTVRREELFVVSKLFQTHHAWEGDGSRCWATLEQTLAELQLEYLDLLLIHWPFAFLETALEKPPGTPQPLRLADGTPNPLFTIKMEYLSTWAEMEKMVGTGKVRSIGVSNFTAAQIEHLFAEAAIRPAVNQIEVHPYCSQQPLVDWCEQHGVRVMGYSPLGSQADWAPAAAGHTLLKHPTVTGIAEPLGKSPAQVLIRWGLQRHANLVSIPKSSNPGRIGQNLDVLDWSLGPEEMAALDGLNIDHRYFISYLKRPENDLRWHDGVIEQGNDADFVSGK